jgi:hypothetical protein
VGEFVQLFPLQPSVEYLTHIAAIPPKVNVILVVGHGVLYKRELAVRLHRRGTNLPESWSGGYSRNQGRFERAGYRRRPLQCLKPE